MQIVLIGSGNVAFHLAKAFTEAQIPISQIFGRNTTELQKISEQFSIPFLRKLLLMQICTLFR